MEPSLTATEKQATVADLLKTRSGGLPCRGRFVTHGQFGRLVQLILDAKKKP